MTEDEPDLVIETVEDLFDAVRSEDFVLRIALLKQISAEPEAALSFGKLHDLDIVDELVHQGYQSCGVTYLKALMVALAAFESDPRALEFLKKIFSASERPDIVDLAARLLAKSAGLSTILPEMRVMLNQDNSEKHARAAARVFAARQELFPTSAAERLRLVLLTPPTTPLDPPFGAADLQSKADWRRELEGTFAVEARLRLESLGEPSAALLVELWPHLSEDTQAWVLLWATPVAPLRLLPTLEQVLKAEVAPLTVQLAAIEAVPLLGGAASLLQPLLTRFLVSERAVPLRAAALRSGAPVTVAQLEECLAQDDSPAVRIEAMRLLATLAGEAALETFLGLLQADDWETRSAAADALAQLPAEPVIAAVRPLVFHEVEGIRVAAANVLIAHGDDIWLEDTFLS